MPYGQRPDLSFLIWLRSRPQSDGPGNGGSAGRVAGVDFQRTSMAEDLSKVRRIVIRGPNWVGDVVMATPFFDCLRMNFPDSQIACAVRPKLCEVVRDGPWFCRTIGVNDSRRGGVRETARQIREFGADMAVVLPNSFRSALEVWLGGAKRIYGYRGQFRGMFLTGGPRRARGDGGIVPVAMQQYYLEIARWLGLRMPERVKPRLYIGAETQRRADAFLSRYGIDGQQLVIGLNPGASFGPSKRWPAEYFAELAELLERRFGAKVILFFGPGEDETAQRIVSATKANVIDTSGERVDLDLLKPLVRRCDVFVTNDTGPRQYAVAFDVPVVVIVGPTDPGYTSSNLERTEVIREQLDCMPCHKKVCPRGHECMTRIMPETVLEAVGRLLEKWNQRL